jgi:hypothetical protein
MMHFSYILEFSDLLRKSFLGPRLKKKIHKLKNKHPPPTHTPVKPEPGAKSLTRVLKDFLLLKIHWP